jgi:hypothetical protein
MFLFVLSSHLLKIERKGEIACRNIVALFGSEERDVRVAESLKKNNCSFIQPRVVGFSFH